MNKKSTQNRMPRLMKVTTTISLAILLLVVNATINKSVAQTISSDAQQKSANTILPIITDVVTATPAVASSAVITVIPASEPVLPYINYRGITNPDQAKEAWIKDNPEAYKKLFTPAATPTVTDTPTYPANFVMPVSASDGTPVIINQQAPADNPKQPQIK